VFLFASISLGLVGWLAVVDVCWCVLVCVGLQSHMLSVVCMNFECILRTFMRCWVSSEWVTE
jgi:hypothetical protein